MTATRNIVNVPVIKAGELIKARYLSSMAGAINRNSKALSGPRQQNALEESNQGAPLVDLNFSETSRASTAKTVTDSNGDTFSITQIDQVTLTNASGDTMTLTFNNP